MYILSLIFLELFEISFLLIPIWDLKNSSIILVSPTQKEINITIYDQYYYNCNAKLTKSITIYGETNRIRVAGENEVNTEWDDIESQYYFDYSGHFVCPKGKYFLNQYDNNKFKIKKPSDFNNDSTEWELLCYYNQDWMFQGFLNRKTKTKFYALKIDSNLTTWQNFTIEDGLLDFIWTTVASKRFYDMLALLLKNSMIYLETIPINIISRNDTIQIQTPISSKPLHYNSTYTHAYFDKENLFYWMSSNTTKDFKSGYSTQKADVGTTIYEHFGIKMNDKSPFYFLKNVTINTLNMIRNTRFVYY